MHRWIQRSLFALMALLAVSGVAMQQVPNLNPTISVSPSALILTIVGIVAGWMTLGKFADRQIDTRLRALDSPLALHEANGLAHEAMRKQLAQEYNVQFELLRGMINDYRREDGERLQQMRTEMIKPLIDLNSSQRQVVSDTLKYMADSIAGLADAMRLVQPTLKVRD